MPGFRPLNSEGLLEKAHGLVPYEVCHVLIGFNNECLNNSGAIIPKILLSLISILIMPHGCVHSKSIL